MRFEPNKLYHIYNQGNNHQPIFFSRANYFYFLRKMRKQLVPVSDILAYCLMPNHFHWLLYVKEIKDKLSSTHQIAPSDLMGKQHSLVNKIAVLLRSYTQGVNNQEKRSGSLFRQKTKAVEIGSREYGRTCIYYIHQNPLKGNLVHDLKEWDFSSFPDHAGFRDGTLINKKKAIEMLELNLETFREDSYRSLNSKEIRKITSDASA